MPLVVCARLLILCVVPGAPGSGWVTFTEDTSARLQAPAAVTTADNQEKDYAWADLDQDGDTDLVCVRKQPWNTPGRFRNVLFMNEGTAEGHAIDGVLVDRTQEFASAATDGGQGMLDATADRDVAIVDVNDDGWLDIVTSTTYGEGQPKSISHPRVYINLGLDGDAWQGLRYEEFRSPTMPLTPHFCGMGYGDVTGDDIPDLYFVDYNGDLEDRLWINDGSGTFIDETDLRMTGQMVESDFGVHAVIADINADGANDIIKDRGSTATQPPLRVTAAYNDPNNEGVFNIFDIFYNGNPYHTEVGDLNNDGLLDIVVEDDGSDRYFLNQGVGDDTVTDFVSFTFAPGPDSFGGNIVIRDLDADGFNDVLIADVDVDCCGCTRSARFWRNQGDTPNVTFEQHDLGIPIPARTGTHDIAVFDLNGDGALDLVLGTCTGMSIWIRDVPIVDLDFNYPNGRPEFIDPGTTTALVAEVSAGGQALSGGASATLHVSVADGPFTPTAMTPLGAGQFEGQLPASACGEQVRYYISAQDGGGSDTDPADAPTTSYAATSAFGRSIVFSDSLEAQTDGWTVVNDPTLSSGAWEAAVPLPTHSGADNAAPGSDADGAFGHIRAFVTDNGVMGAAAGVADVDGGPTQLISPAVELFGADGFVSFALWFYTSEPQSGDLLRIEVSADDGGNWSAVDTIAEVTSGWQPYAFRIGDYVTPAGPVRVRLTISDQMAEPGASVVEAGIDAFRVESLQCAACVTHDDCDNGLFCDGVEQCDGSGHCLAAASAACAGLCDEGNVLCVDCLHDAHCDDGAFCTGVEACGSGGLCAAGRAPCAGQLCDELADACGDCSEAADCDDGLYCNGAEACQGGACAAGIPPCSNAACDEGANVCTGPLALQPRMGDPLAGLSVAEHQRFLAGRDAFGAPFDAAEGLGPIFNQISCGVCHNNPIGGSGTITVTRFGTLDLKSSAFDGLDALGGSLLQAQAIDDSCLEQVPPEADIVTTRTTPSTLGFGLLEAIPDDAIAARAKNPPAPGISGRVHLVEPLEAPGTQRVGRFGWKAQVPTVLTFSADAALNEMGITSDLLPTENAPNGDGALLAQCDTIPDPEDSGPPGTRFIDLITDFQRFSAAPPQTPKSGMSGEALFEAVGCTLCHVPAFVTADDPGLEDALRDRVVRPYSDFLLHDMGILFDGIQQGDAGPSEIRTAPLWGLRVRDPLLHDGSVSGGTFAERVTEAIVRHGDVGSEAQTSVSAFLALTGSERDAVIAFLDSLGRAEFDHDGDGDVDEDDFIVFMGCFYGAGDYTPDNACAISDIDQDGDVDGEDFTLFLQAFDGPEPDCNDNGISDIAEVFDGSAADCNQNGRPDACDVLSGTVEQWATNVEAFSSEYNLSPPNFLAIQTLGVPDTFTFGANGTAWSPLEADGNLEFITLGYDTPVFATGVVVRETEGNGFVYQVDAIDTADGVHTVWSGNDPSPPGTPVDFLITWPQTPYAVQALTIHTDTNTAAGWESIDAVQLQGVGLGNSPDKNANGVPDECEVGCTAVADCADVNADGIRDDGCVFWACEAGACLDTTIDYADMGGANGACAVDGTADGNDRFHALNCFSNQTTLGAAGYSCETDPPSAMNVDAAGLSAPCSPDGVCDGNDAFAALNAFDGTTPCSCSAPTPQAPAAVASEQANIALEPAAEAIRAGQTVEVHLYLTEPQDDLRGYQLHVQATGGRQGTLTLVDWHIAPRRDFVFNGLGAWQAFNVQTAQMVAGLDSSGVATTSRAYLATAVFRASSNATGSFTIELLHDPADPSHRSALFSTEPGQRVDLQADLANIEVESKRSSHR